MKNSHLSTPTDATVRRTSKFLSLLLRHRPETIGLELDPHGWASIDQLIELANASEPGQLNRALIDIVVATSDKQRFAISADGSRIRANQGHSLDVDLNLQPAEPPDQLFHGTASQFLDAILDEGLTKQSRQHVHLSADRATAINVGGRRGRPVVLEVDAAAMHADDHLFFRSVNAVWLTDAVPSAYLTVSDHDGPAPQAT